MTYHSKLYDFPAFADAVPDLDGWLMKDPFGANPYGTVHRLGEETRVITRLPATVTLPVEAGEEHTFAVAADRLRFFDAATGERSAPVPLREG